MKEETFTMQKLLIVLVAATIAVGNPLELTSSQEDFGKYTVSETQILEFINHSKVTFEAAISNQDYPL